MKREAKETEEIKKRMNNPEETVAKSLEELPKLMERIQDNLKNMEQGRKEIKQIEKETEELAMLYKIKEALHELFLEEEFEKFLEKGGDIKALLDKEKASNIPEKKVLNDSEK